MHYITGVHFSGGAREEHVASVRWLRASDGISDTSTTEAMVKWLGQGNAAFVGGVKGRVQVGVVRPATGRPYLRTYADGDWTDNLLNLPQY
jgi:Protein of unknown function (DUF3892)